MMLEHEDERWDSFNVLGQVVNVIREEHQGRGRQGPSRDSKRQLKQHIRIPAAYQSGISLFVLTSNEAAYRELSTCPQLPLMENNHTKIHASL